MAPLDSWIAVNFHANFIVFMCVLIPFYSFDWSLNNYVCLKIGLMDDDPISIRTLQLRVSKDKFLFDLILLRVIRKY